jgi:hypothetical protein
MMIAVMMMAAQSISLCPSPPPRSVDSDNNGTDDDYGTNKNEPFCPEAHLSLLS